MRLMLAALMLVIPTASFAQDSSSPRCALKSGISPAQARSGICGFNVVKRRFAGTPRDQARCLLREVRIGAVIGDVVAPERLITRAGTRPTFTRERLASYVASHGVLSTMVGLDGAGVVGAEYFVIHDTSSPNCSAVREASASCPIVGGFPPLLNDARWPVNQTFGGHRLVGRVSPIAHGWTNRIGESIIEVPFDRHISHLKFDYCHDAMSKRGLFVGVENIQPRIGRPAIPTAGRAANDLIAPTPGFTDAQYERLALLYAVASIRHGRWLVPAFHAVIDARYRDGHDDPQRFDLGRFDEAVANVVRELERTA